MADNFMRVDEQDLCTLVEDVGLSELPEFIDGQLDKWRKIPLNVAITGSSGMGKSSFINAFLGLSADDNGSAAVGVIEQTKEVTSYPHPSNANLTFWDLPGVGTPNFPKDTYCEKVQLRRFDFFLILTNARFTENDHWLAKTIDKQQKNSFFFIRTKIDMDMKNNKKSHPKSHNEEKALAEVRKYLLDNLSPECEDKIFLLSSFYPDRWDFANMTEKMMENLPQIKREALTMSLTSVTSTVVDRKYKLLRDRIWKVAEESSRRPSYPIPYVKLRVCIPLLARELNFYKKQFGLEEHSLETQALRLGISLEIMKQDLTMVDKDITHEYVLDVLKTTYIQTAEGLIRKYPSLKDQGISYVASHELLKDHINEMQANALSVLGMSLKHKIGFLQIIAK